MSRSRARRKHACPSPHWRIDVLTARVLLAPRDRTPRPISVAPTDDTRGSSLACSVQSVDTTMRATSTRETQRPVLALARTPALESVPRRARRLAARPCVLLAEGDPNTRQLLTGTLRSDGHEVLAARDGLELLEILASRLLLREPQVDLIVSGHPLPRVTGLSVLVGLRDSDWKTPFILMTALGTPALLDQALREGATVFDKPFDINDFRMTVLDLTFPCAVHGVDGPRCSVCGGRHHVRADAPAPASFVCLECASADPAFAAVDADACSACGRWHHIRAETRPHARHTCVECLGPAGKVSKLYRDIGGSG